MNLFWMELKKIFTWPVILLVVILNLLLFKLLIEFDLEHFPNGRPGLDIFQVEREMIDQYGEVMDEDEFKDFKAIYEKRVKEADEFLQKDALAMAAGVNTYEAFRDGDIDDPAVEKMLNNIRFGQNEDLFWELQAREWMIDRYENRIILLEDKATVYAHSAGEKKRAEEMLADEKFQYYDAQVLENFQRYASQVLVIILLSIAIVLSPIYVRDKMRDLVPLQYTSKKGRRTFHKKWLAGLTAIGILSAVQLLIYGALYLTNDTSHYFFMHVYSMSFQIVWYDITFGPYILLTIAVIIVLGYLFGMLTMACSALLANYLAQISAQIVLFSAFAIVVIPMGVQRMIWSMHPVWLVPLIYISLIIGVYLISRIVGKRELVRDV